ncbi:MAG TPA: hypothetical protein VHM48_07720, partial [Candidatus Limnocylindrales bacterium]|nr:hypothetical protein [Candidatus Limnocylindrales bacterium]
MILIAVVALVAACGATVQPSPPVASSSTAPSLATGSVDPAESAPDPGDGGQFELPTPGCPS